MGVVRWKRGKVYPNYVMSGGGVIPELGQDAQDPVRFLKRRYYLTPAGLVISPHEKYIGELVGLYALEARAAKATPDGSAKEDSGIGLDEEETKTFRSGMGTLLYLSQDRPDIQHCVRGLAQHMSFPTKDAVEKLKRLILYLKGTEEHSVLLPYNVPENRKVFELMEKKFGSCKHKVEVFTDAAWGGDKTSQEHKRHSVSSGMLYVDGRFVLNWSRTQRSIALSSCESEYYAAVGGAAEALFVARPWEFLVRAPNDVAAISDSSSRKAFSQRLGVGRLKHIETRVLWLQTAIKMNVLSMESVPTLLNLSDLGTKQLSKQRRSFLMYLMGMVKKSEDEKGFMPVGEDDYVETIQRKTIAQDMKHVKKVMVQTLAEADGSKVAISTSMVKTVTMLALLPGVRGEVQDVVDKVSVTLR